MKKLVLALLSFISLSAFAQGTLTVTVSDSSSTAAGVAVYFFDSPSSFYPNGYVNPPVIENFDRWSYTNSNGVTSFSLSGIALNDTVFWATQDCGGNLVWGAGSPTTINPNISGALSLNCLPGDCDVVLTVDSATTPTATYGIVQAFPLRQFSNTSLPSALPSRWNLNGSSSTGFTSANYDSITFNMNSVSAPYTIAYSRVDSICAPTTVSFGTGSNLSCAALIYLDTSYQLPGAYSLSVTDSSSTNGNVIAYQLDLGDGTIVDTNTILSGYFHRYSNPGTYRVCASLVSVLGNDTCSASLCTSIYVGPSGGGVGPSCAASYVVDTVNSGTFNNQLILWETSTTNGQITSWSWDFGDGTTINSRYPSHTYANNGIYNVCLSITAIDSGGTNCTSTFCDSIGFDSNGNLVFKNGFTINVIDPATVSLEEDLLNSSLTMFPNPAQEKVNLTWDAQLEVSEIRVLSISGSLVKQMPVGGNTAQIENLPAGAYLVQVESAGASKTLRLIVQ